MRLLAGETFNQPLWSLPGLGTLTLNLDRLSAVFLFVTGLVLFPASIFAGGELNRESESSGGAFTVLMFGLYASIVLIFIAGDAVLFLLAWEVMSVFCYLLIVHGTRIGKTAMPTPVIFCWRWAKPEPSPSRWVFLCSRSMPVRWIFPG